MKIKNYKSQNFILTLDLYPFDIMISINQKEDELKNSLDECGIKYKKYITKLKRVVSRPCVATTYDVGENRTLIVFRDLNNTSRSAGTIAHEIFHAIENVFEVLPIQHSSDSSEAWAYAIGYITKQFYEKLNEK